MTPYTRVKEVVQEEVNGTIDVTLKDGWFFEDGSTKKTFKGTEEYKAALEATDNGTEKAPDPQLVEAMAAIGKPKRTRRTKAQMEEAKNVGL